MARRELAPIKEQVYLDPRPAEYFDRFHEHARTREPDWLYTFVRIVSYPYCKLAFRLRTQHRGRVPATGPVILAPNHFSAMDHWFVGIELRRRVRFMAKSQLFKGRALEFIMPHGGAFPVRRGQRDEEAIETALTILRRGGVIVIYPEGGRSRSATIGESARPGIGRLALQSGAPVVPVAINGSRAGAQLAPAAVPVGDSSLRRADALSDRARSTPRAPAAGRRRGICRAAQPARAPGS